MILSQIGLVISVTPKQDIELKASGFVAWNFFKVIVK